MELLVIVLLVGILLMLVDPVLVGLIEFVVICTYLLMRVIV
jgi:hypothetical protein